MSTGPAHRRLGVRFDDAIWADATRGFFVAFGPRHPGPGVRSVYERAHRQLHGRFPDRR